MPMLAFLFRGRLLPRDFRSGPLLAKRLSPRRVDARLQNPVADILESYGS
jgi:hypothetical protein